MSLILPDRNVANLLPAFLARQRTLAATSTSRPGAADDDNVLLLEELSILCRESTVINDRVVAALAPSLAGSHLTSLALAGCAKLTGAPLVALLPTRPHLRQRAREACALDPPSFFPAAAPHLAALESLKLTHPGPRHPSLAAFFPALEALLDHTRALTALTLYHSGASATGRREWPVVPLGFVQHVAATVGARLRKFEVSGVLVGVEAVEALLDGARGLSNLVLHLGHDFDLVRPRSLPLSLSCKGDAEADDLSCPQPRLTASFAPLASLRTLHLLSQRADISPDDVLSLAEQCVPLSLLSLSSIPTDPLSHADARRPCAKSASATASGSSGAPTRPRTHPPRSVSRPTTSPGSPRRSWSCAPSSPRGACALDVSSAFVPQLERELT